jgi:hypothetical protein
MGSHSVAQAGLEVEISCLYLSSVDMLLMCKKLYIYKSSKYIKNLR